VRTALCGLLAVVLASPATPATGQETTSRHATGPQQAADAGQPSAPREPQVPVDPDALPIDIGRIRRKLEQPQPPVRLDFNRPIFRVEVIQKRPDWVGEIDWLGNEPNVPHPTRPAWHDEFLAMTTPPQARLFGQSNNLDLLQLVATSVVQAALTGALVGKVRSAAAARREAEARREVDDAIAAWKKAREERQSQPAAPDPQQRQ
jgi:hypothetical protein